MKLPAGKCEDPGGSRVGGVPSELKQMQMCRLICLECTEKAVSYVEHCTVNGEPFDEFVQTVPSVFKSVITWVGCECCKRAPLLDRFGLGTCVRFCGVLIKAPTGMGCPCGLSCN